MPKSFSLWLKVSQPLTIGKFDKTIEAVGKWHDFDKIARCARIFVAEKKFPTLTKKDTSTVVNIIKKISKNTYLYSYLFCYFVIWY